MRNQELVVQSGTPTRRTGTRRRSVGTWRAAVVLNALPGSGWVLPPDDALDELVSDGLIALEPVDVLCEERGGEGCPGWAEVLRADEPPCPECERPLFVHESEARRWGRARVQPDGVEAWMERRLATEGLDARLLGGMAWRVTLAADEVVVALLDWSESSRWTRAEALASAVREGTGRPSLVHRAGDRRRGLPRRLGLISALTPIRTTLGRGPLLYSAAMDAVHPK